jgi:hypothetical protein
MNQPIIVGIEQAEMECRLRRLEDIVARFSVYASRYPQYKMLFKTHQDADAYMGEFGVKRPDSMSVVEIVQERMDAASAALANGDMDAYREISKQCSGRTYGDVVREGKK